MGGRGAASGISNKGITYGSDYKTILQKDNIKFVVSAKPGSVAVPIETMSFGKNRVYVLINNKGEMKSIAFYNSKGFIRRQIDFGHDHGQGKPHVHTGFDANRRSAPLNKSDKAYIRKVKQIWEKS